MLLYFIQGNDQADVKQDMLKFDKRKDDNYSRPQVVVIRRATTEPVFVDVYGHLGIDSKNRFRMKN